MNKSALKNTGMELLWFSAASTALTLLSAGKVVEAAIATALTAVLVYAKYHLRTDASTQE